jgi:hypothetical protein
VRALERRQKLNIPLDPTDFPVCSSYVEELKNQVDSLRFSLRWINGVSVCASESQIEKILKIPFVKGAEKLNCSKRNTLASYPVPEPSYFDPTKASILYKHIRESMNLDTLTAKGLDGKGIRIAILDAGFKKVDEHPAFSHLRENNRILACRDFFSGKDEGYFHSFHGTGVLGCLGGYYEDKPFGAATGAEYILARTESEYSERLIEEDCWLAAMEWADSMGADILSSSLGYSDKRYEYKDLDGMKTSVTKAANLAVKKGMIVVIANGNEGNNNFKYLSAPADGDSVIYRGVLKPEVSAPGYVLVPGKNNGFEFTAGTSFACPLVSGFIACMMQLHPDWSPGKIREELFRTCNMFPYFDYRMGYGVPDATLLFHKREAGVPFFEVKESGDSLTILFSDSLLKKDPLNFRNGIPVFYHVQGEDGRLTEFQSLIIPKKVKGFRLPATIKARGRLRIWINGYLYEEEE